MWYSFSHIGTKARIENFPFLKNLRFQAVLRNLSFQEIYEFEEFYELAEIHDFSKYKQITAI